MGIHSVIAALARRVAPAPMTDAPAPDSLSGYSAAPGPDIPDGVDYGLPAVLPRQLHEGLKRAGKVGAWLAEAAREQFRFTFDTPYTGDNVPFAPPTEDPLREWSASTREYVLTNTHAAYARNPIANRGVKFVASFVVGEGFNLVCKHRDVQAVLDAFIEHPDNRLRGYERQAVIDLCVDGELMLRWFDAPDGVPALVPQRPWECQWIRTEPGFFRRAVSYRFVRTVQSGDSPDVSTTEQEDVPAEAMVHVAINRHGYELRGRPELYSILPWLRAYKEWLENRARQNHWRNAVLWHVSVASTAGAVISAVASRWRKPPSPGTVAVTSDKETITAVNNPVGGSDAAEDGRQIKLMNAVGLGLPEYMLSDGSNSNLASASRQQLPALTTFAEYQRILCEELWYPVFERVIRQAIDAGRLPEQVAEEDADGDPVTDDDGMPVMCDTCDAFSVTYAPIQQTDIVNIANAMNVALTNNLVSRETASTELGFDWSVEQKRMDREDAKSRDDMAAGLKPMPPGMMPPGYTPDDEDEADAEDEAEEEPDDAGEPVPA